MFLQTLCLCALVWAFGEASLEEINLAINSTGAKWVAASTTWEKIYRSALLREHPLGRGSHTNATVTGPLEEMPTEFDIRSEFSKCESVSTIFDQGSCGGCWALSVAAVLSDRFCQQSIDVLLSPQDLLDCVSGSSNGCSGGFTEDGFDYVADEGIRTNSCVPFEAMDGFCATGCADGSKRNADGTKYFTQSWAQYISSDEEKIQQELMSYGSISAVFEVFEDFFNYKSGVYSHVSGDYAGLHAVALMGWGESDAEGKYWIVKNSWGVNFGEEGYFRIARGLDENGCNFEGGLTAANVAL